MFTFHKGDCLPYMKSQPDGFFDLIVTDPPYGLGIAANPVRQKHERENWDNAIPQDEVFAEMFRVSKHQIIWGGNYYPLPPHKNYLIWDKQQPENFTLAMCEMAWTSFDMPAKIFRYSVTLHKNPLRSCVGVSQNLPKQAGKFLTPSLAWLPLWSPLSNWACLLTVAKYHRSIIPKAQGVVSRRSYRRRSIRCLTQRPPDRGTRPHLRHFLSLNFYPT